MLDANSSAYVLTVFIFILSEMHRHPDRERVPGESGRTERHVQLPSLEPTTTTTTTTCIYHHHRHRWHHHKPPWQFTFAFGRHPSGLYHGHLISSLLLKTAISCEFLLYSSTKSPIAVVRQLFRIMSWSDVSSLHSWTQQFLASFYFAPRQNLLQLCISCLGLLCSLISSLCGQHFLASFYYLSLTKSLINKSCVSTVKDYIMGRHLKPSVVDTAISCKFLCFVLDKIVHRSRASSLGIFIVSSSASSALVDSVFTLCACEEFETSNIP
jgi:hypothetical protein